MTQSELNSQVNKKVQQLMMVGAVDDVKQPVRYLFEIDLTQKAALDASYGKHVDGKAVSASVYVDELTSNQILKFKKVSPWRTQLNDFVDNLKTNITPSVCEKHKRSDHCNKWIVGCAAFIGTATETIPICNFRRDGHSVIQYYVRLRYRTIIFAERELGIL